MSQNEFTAQKITVCPKKISFYMPPVIWKGDPIGHIGESNVFFWLLEGEVALFVGSECYLMRAGQLGFMPKGKMRRYLPVSKDITLYTMSFSAESDGIDLMQGLGLTEKNHVVSIENADQITHLFESSSYIGMHNEPINNLVWNANLLAVIKEFYSCIRRQIDSYDSRFLPVIEYMKDNVDRTVSTDELAAIAHMQPTYFIRRFKQNYNTSPMTYFKGLRINRAVELILTTDADIESIAASLGMEDTSYFSRWFKKSCGLPPAEYRKRFLDFSIAR